MDTAARLSAYGTAVGSTTAGPRITFRTATPPAPAGAGHEHAEGGH